MFFGIICHIVPYYPRPLGGSRKNPDSNTAVRWRFQNSELDLLLDPSRALGYHTVVQNLGTPSLDPPKKDSGPPRALHSGYPPCLQHGRF